MLLYRGTRYAGSILETGVLFRAPCPHEAAQVCLTDRRKLLHLGNDGPR